MSIIDNHLDHLVLGDREFCSGSHISHPVSEVSKILIGFHLFLGDLHNGWAHLDAMAKLGDKRENHLSKALGFSHWQVGHPDKGISSKRLKEEIREQIWVSHEWVRFQDKGSEMIIRI